MHCHISGTKCAHVCGLYGAGKYEAFIVRCYDAHELHVCCHILHCVSASIAAVWPVRPHVTPLLKSGCIRKRALRTVGGTKFRTYLTNNPDLSGHRMYTDKTADVPNRDRVSASRLRLSSYRLAVETGRWSRKPQNKRLCLCGDVQTEEHVICFCPRMALVRSRFDEIRFTSIADFFGCDDVRSVCRMCTLALTVND